MLFANFNSIKVRLEPQADYRGTEGHEFQFHKGTIRTDVNKALAAYDTISIP